MPGIPFGGPLATRPLHFIWIADCSGSMTVDGKIQALNHAIREAIPHMRQVAADNTQASVFVRAVSFSTGAQWHIAEPTPVEDFAWSDVHAGGVTDLGAALLLVAEQLRMPPMSERGLPPILALISDGHPTDDWVAGLRAVDDLPWGKKAVRAAMAIGGDADEEVLQRFIGNIEFKPLRADNPEALVKRIRWLSTVVLKAASAPASQPLDGASLTAHVPIPAPPVNDPSSSIDPW